MTMKLTIRIDGCWEPVDFIETFQSIEALYYLAMVRERKPFFFEDDLRFAAAAQASAPSYGQYVTNSNQWMLTRARSTLPNHWRMQVHKVRFASPGGIDFAGIGKAIEAVERIVGRIIDFYAHRGLRREWDEQASIETEMKRQTLASMKIDNARKILDLRRDFPDHEHLIALAVHNQDLIADRIAQGLIVSSETKEGE